MIIRLFGAFRNLQSEPELSLETQARTVGELRVELARSLGAMRASFDAAGLLSKSAIANDREVLDDAALLTGEKLALLPPVSGG